MKIIRYEDPSGRIHYAAQDEGTTTAFRIEGDILGDYRVTTETAEIARTLPPIANPPAILGIGLNYRQHAIETGAKIPEYPILFFKSPSSLQGHRQPIELPRRLHSDEVDYECELAVVIGKRCKNVLAEEALAYVLGYTCANDVSARDWQMKKGGSQWSRGKTFDTFCPLGPCLVTADEIPDPNALSICTLLNGEVVQDSNTADMIFPVKELIAFLSSDTTLEPGTILLTGTPQGVGMAANPPRFLKPGDEVTVEIQNIGALTNPVTEA